MAIRRSRSEAAGTFERVAAFNRGRDPVRLALKYQRMATDPFVFLRGACHLFYADLPRHAAFARAPLAWLCGDLHLENFGGFRGENRLSYFDLNDFDEAALAPCSFDIVRLLTSMRLIAANMRVESAQTEALCTTALNGFSAELAAGKARWIERETADGIIGGLLHNLDQRGRRALLDSRTRLRGGRRRINTDGERALPATAAEIVRVTGLLDAYASTQRRPRRLRVLDVARRIAGTGSLGVERYVILTEGKGSPDDNWLLDLKRARASCLDATLGNTRPRWSCQAQRIISVQRQIQASPPAGLAALRDGARSYVLKELQPRDDRLDFAAHHAKANRLSVAVERMGQLAAWGTLRASGWRGSANADQLMAFAGRHTWQKALLDVSGEMAERTTAQWRAFCAGLASSQGEDS